MRQILVKETCICEACVESAAEIDAALAGGADRIELCSRLDEGGLTPTREMLAYAAGKIPVAAMLRNRNDFTATAADRAELARDIALLAEFSPAAIVFGYIKNGEIDADVLSSLIDDIRGYNNLARAHLVFHMAFDALPRETHFSAIDTLARLGFTRILTKGGSGAAMDNLAHLKELHAYARGKVVILCGGKVTDDNFAEIYTATGITEFHGRQLGVRP